MGNFHSLSLEEAFQETESGAQGLSALEAERRLKRFGKNAIPVAKPLSKLRLFSHQFNNPLMFIVLAAVAISFFLRHYSDAVFIVAVILINTCIGFYQEFKAGRTFQALKKLVRIRAQVLRDGSQKEIDSEELVKGDVVIVRAGSKIPADGRIVESKNLKINESILTGESSAVEKKNISCSQEAQLGDRFSMAFTGTVVEEGWGKVLITATGKESELGKIVSLVRETKEQMTPLQKKIAYLSKIVGAFITSLIGAIVLIGYFRGESFADIFVASLALAVSAIPEGLIPAITVILVLGMRRILKKKGLVRQLIATETLGSVTVICTDKTGTLTEGNMRVSHILTSSRELMGEGIGGIARGENMNGIESHITALKVAVLANEGFIENKEAELQEWVIRGSHTEQALLLAGAEAGLDKNELEMRYPVIDRRGFDSDSKYSVSLHRAGDHCLLYVIGAPEKIIALMAEMDADGKNNALDSAESRRLLEKFEELTAKGLRVLACAYKKYSIVPEYANLNVLVNDLVLIGFIAIKDPLRAEARGAIEAARKAGIKTVIITGDHKLTAKTIGEELGMNIGEENILEGKDLDALSDLELREKAKKILLYTRVSPRHKVQIINALSGNGEVAAMIGDGVNDAPALKAAHIGISVGSGTDVAKETADLVLLDNSFQTVVKAVEQGRLIFQNIRKVFVYLVADDFSEIFLFLAAMSFGFPLPLLPAQILWINFVEDGFPDIALTTEQETKGLMEEKPRNPKEPILSKPLKLWMTAIFFVTGIAAFLTFYFLWKATGDLDKTRTMVFALMALDSLIFSYSVRSFNRTIFRWDIFSNYYLVGATIIGLVLLFGAVYFPPLQKLISTQPLLPLDWGIIAAISAVEIIFLEFFKYLIFILPKKKSQKIAMSPHLSAKEA